MGDQCNRLADASSPYLQQHAANPVDWWPWCPEALQLAQREDRPILLSIGYSACHWCHVMAHESFEDTETAALMNRLFVNIKVDREERPDLDKLYQTAHQLLAQRPGGWPLTVFLMPGDHTPFFAGTYFPPTARHGLPSFRDLLQKIHTAFREQRGAIAQQNDSLHSAMQRLQAQGDGDRPDASALAGALRQLDGSFDAQHGGFGSAPKFPHPDSLAFLLDEARHNSDGHARGMLTLTLERMAEGGMHDLLGGGFCRYSVDERWMIPHFEKMLYDNAQLLALYADAWTLEPRPLFRHTCTRTADWLMREMQAADGGYFSSLDADSEGGEGLYYLWTPQEVGAVLDDAEYAVFGARFGLDRGPNFEGRWHLHTFTPTAALAAQTGGDARAVRRLLRSARDKLLARRETRTGPGRDEKILASWNALAIRAMARAGRIFEQPEWVASAERALAYLVRTHLRDGRLLASSRNGMAGLNAYLDDYAYLLDAVLELLQARWRDADLALALQLAAAALQHFEDREDGGFWFTSDDHERLMQRMKPFTDDAVPAGNGVMAHALQTLTALTGDPAYLAAAERTLACAWPAIRQTPYAHTSLLLALRESLQPGETVIVRGPDAAARARATALQAENVPGRRVFAVPDTAAGLPAGLAARRAPHAGTLAYRCTGTRCASPEPD